MRPIPVTRITPTTITMEAQRTQVTPTTRLRGLAFQATRSHTLRTTRSHQWGIRLLVLQLGTQTLRMGPDPHRLQTSGPEGHLEVASGDGTHVSDRPSTNRSPGKGGEKRRRA